MGLADRRRRLVRLLTAPARLVHKHRVDPDLSALVSFPSCGCGALIWPADGAPATRPAPAPRPSSERSEPH